ncbi:hypothetical protein GMLC_10740 [Geomonas limicola]|uniref:Uncharacterized protein n=1 Tax=Geomonas limicola TaxID=2740186 RepID=A0A6V8N4M4_9BACT|nr:hypothetical protein [Geomonas limicola]GFO67495.1 hypothetical protein GMLC_10740 [Geomonas limicola]
MSLTEQERLAIKENLFPVAALSVLDDPRFPWHRIHGEATAKVPHSSQALAVDFFGTVKQLTEPDRIWDAMASRWGLPSKGGWQLSLERCVPLAALGEPTPTQVDATVESETAFIAFECKFTEPDGGGCSQIKPLSSRSPNRGKVQCSGNYSLQENPVNGICSPCALTGKGIRYWEVVPRILSIGSDVDHSPCPFKGGWFQWMRNLAACSAMTESSKKRGAFVVLYMDGPFPMAKRIRSSEWQKLISLTEGRTVPLITVSYQEMLVIAMEAAAPYDTPVLKRLEDWMQQKALKVSAQKGASSATC